MEDLLRVGVISSTHGIRGEVKVYPTTNTKERFLSLKKVFLITKNEKRILEIENVKFFKQMVILKFKEINNINDIEAYKNAELFITREEATPLMEEEYHYADLIGMDCFTQKGEHLGTLTEILETGANDVYVINGEKYQNLMIPAIKDCILKVDVNNKKMEIHLLEGLI